jgi:glutaredoxin 3
MKNITIYTTNTCPYCVKAKSLLNKKNAIFTEINVEDEDKRNKMMELTSGRRSVPQIFIGDQHVGGCDDLYELERTGELDQLLSR